MFDVSVTLLCDWLPGRAWLRAGVRCTCDASATRCRNHRRGQIARTPDVERLYDGARPAVENFNGPLKRSTWCRRRACGGVVEGTVVWGGARVDRSGVPAGQGRDPAGAVLQPPGGGATSR